MTRLIIAALFALTTAGTASAAEKDGSYTSAGALSCGMYLGAYSKAELSGEFGLKADHTGHRIVGWIDGFITAYNMKADNGKSNVLGTMTLNDARRWVASWCRDNPSNGLDEGINALMDKLDK